MCIRRRCRNVSKGFPAAAVNFFFAITTNPVAKSFPFCELHIHHIARHRILYKYDLSRWPTPTPWSAICVISISFRILIFSYAPCCKGKPLHRFKRKYMDHSVTTAFNELFLHHHKAAEWFAFWDECPANNFPARACCRKSFIQSFMCFGIVNIFHQLSVHII